MAPIRRSQSVAQRQPPPPAAPPADVSMSPDKPRPRKQLKAAANRAAAVADIPAPTLPMECAGKVDAMSDRLVSSLKQRYELEQKLVKAEKQVKALEEQIRKMDAVVVKLFQGWKPYNREDRTADVL